MSKPFRVAVALVSIVILLFCAFTMMVTWSEATPRFVNPVIATGFVAAAALFAFALRGSR